jgi:hypothetical protein
VDATYNGLRLKTVMPAFDAVLGANERQMTGRLRLRYRPYCLFRGKCKHSKAMDIVSMVGLVWCTCAVQSSAGIFRFRPKAVLQTPFGCPVGFTKPTSCFTIFF